MCRHVIAVASPAAEHGLWGAQASVVVARRLSSVVAVVVHRLVAWGMWDLPRPGIEPVSPPLACGFLTTGPSGKSKPQFLHSLAIGWLFLELLLCAQPWVWFYGDTEQKANIVLVLIEIRLWRKEQ